MMLFDLPVSVEFCGNAWEINTDFRDILTILIAFDDDELTDQEKAYVCLHNFYVGFEDIPRDQLQEAYNAAIDFIDHGNTGGEEHMRKTMDWKQDANILFPAVNHVAGYEVRSVDYLHWWTFLGFFMEIKDSTYATVLSLRQKKARGKKLEKYENEFWNNNRAICELKNRESADDKAAKEKYKAILGG